MIQACQKQLLMTMWKIIRWDLAFEHVVDAFTLSMQVNSAFMKKIPKGAEASNILVGEVDFLEKPLSAFIRLQEATILGDLTEVDVPTRFLFVLLGPFVSNFLATHHLKLVICREESRGIMR